MPPVCKSLAVPACLAATAAPLADRNPQRYVPDIYRAQASAFVKAEHRVCHCAALPSRIRVGALR